MPFHLLCICQLQDHHFNPIFKVTVTLYEVYVSYLLNHTYVLVDIKHRLIYEFTLIHSKLAPEHFNLHLQRSSAKDAEVSKTCEDDRQSAAISTEIEKLFIR